MWLVASAGLFALQTSSARMDNITLIEYSMDPAPPVVWNMNLTYPVGAFPGHNQTRRKKEMKANLHFRNKMPSRQHDIWKILSSTAFAACASDDVKAKRS